MSGIDNVRDSDLDIANARDRKELEQVRVGSKMINTEILTKLALDLHNIVNIHLPVAREIMYDITVPVSKLRSIIYNWSGDTVCGSRYNVVRTWYYMVKSHLDNMSIEFDYHDVVDFTYDDRDEETTQYICPVQKEIAVDWWTTNTGDSISGHALKGILKNGRTIVHPITGRPIKYAFLNREKMINLRRWARINYPDLLDKYNDMYIHLPTCSNCGISFTRPSRYSLTSTNPHDFLELQKLLSKGRSSELPLSVLIDPTLNHEYLHVPKQPIIVPLRRAPATATAQAATTSAQATAQTTATEVAPTDSGVPSTTTISTSYQIANIAELEQGFDEITNTMMAAVADAITGSQMSS